MKHHASRRLTLALWGVVLLGVLVMLLGPGLPKSLSGEDPFSLGWDPECRVQTAGGEIGLDREEAKSATTAAVRMSRGLETPHTPGIDEAVLQRLADGPPGDAGPSLTCQGSAASGLVEQQLTATGLTPRAEGLREAMTQVFGDQSLGGFAPGGIDQGHGAESTHYDGRAIDVFFRPVTEENRRQGWLLAHWLVAHAKDLDIQHVIFDDRYWSAHGSRGHWQAYDAPDPDNEILRHLDHVHVDVLGGGGLSG